MLRDFAKLNGAKAPHLHKPQSLRNEGDFAGGAGGHDVDMSLGGIFEWKFFADDGTERAVFQAGVEARENVGGFRVSDNPKSEGTNGAALSHDVTRVDGDFAAIADDNDAAVGGEEFHVGGKIYVGEHFEDDVYSATAGRFHDFVGVSGFGVIESLVRAFFAD